jgi:hypothetical protein
MSSRQASARQSGVGARIKVKVRFAGGAWTQIKLREHEVRRPA